MARVLTNNTAVAYARQTSRGVLGASPTWKTLEPNEITTVGAQITTVARSPISKLRQRRKGTVVDLDSEFEFEADMTIDSLVDFTPAFLFAAETNADLTFRAAPALSGGFTIPAATATQAGKIRFTTGGPITLLWATGYANTANNGLKPLTADTAAAGVLLAVAGNVAETPPTNAEVSVCGIRCEAGDLALSISGGVATLTRGNGASANPVDFTTLGLTKGQRMHVGGLTSTNRFGSTAAADGTRSFGSMRIRTITAASITGDKLDNTLVASDGTINGVGGAEAPVDLLFGRFIRNVAVDSAEFLERYHTFELELVDLYETDPPTPVANPDGYIYPLDNLANEMVVSMPGQDKATIGFGFIGTDTQDPVNNASRKTNAATPIAPLHTGAFNTSTDFARLRIADIDDTGLTTDFKELTATFNNNVSGERVLGTLGPKYLNNGNFDVDIEGTALFTNPLVPARIRANTTVTMDWLLTNDDGAVHFDIPSMTMGSDGLEFPVNESVSISLPCQAFVDSFFGTSLGVSLFPVYPTS